MMHINAANLFQIGQHLHLLPTPQNLQPSSSKAQEDTEGGSKARSGGKRQRTDESGGAAYKARRAQDTTTPLTRQEEVAIEVMGSLPSSSMQNPTSEKLRGKDNHISKG